VFSRRARGALLTGALILVALAVPGTAAAIVQSSQITTPGSTTYPLRDATLPEDGAKITVAGTANVAEVDIRCYYANGTENKLLVEKVAVNGGNFSEEIPRSALPLPSSPNICRLRAVPHGEEPTEPELEEDFKGPILAASAFELLTSRSYRSAFNTLAGTFKFESAEGCGVESNLYNPVSLEASEDLFFCDAYIADNATASLLRIDGAFAYGPLIAASMEETFKKALGAPAVVVEKTFDEETGAVVIHEEDEIVKCSPESLETPTAASCEKGFVSTGVTLKRTWETSADNHVAKMTDTWVSADGKEHTVSFRYYNEMFDDETGGGLYEFPGSAGFADTNTGQQVSLPTGAGTILYKTNAATTEGGDGIWPQGAIVYDSAPSAPLDVTFGTNKAAGEGFNEFSLPYQRTIPPGVGSSSTVRMTFVQGFGLPEVRSLAEAAQASYYPTVSITSPASGTTTTSSPVTVSGNAADAVGLSSLTVDGKAVSVGAGGAWTTTVALNSGANTITATATNQAGNSKSSSVAVTYTPPPTKPAPATASQVGNVSGSKGQATLSLACHGTAGTSCKVHVTLTTVEKLRHGHLIGIAAAKTHSKTVTVASSTITIPAGQTVKVTLKLNATGRKLLKRFGKLPAHITAILEGEAGHHTVIAQNVTIKPVPKKHHKH
jgi:hypothetical protein